MNKCCVCETRPRVCVTSGTDHKSYYCFECFKHYPNIPKLINKTKKEINYYNKKLEENVKPFFLSELTRHEKRLEILLTKFDDV